MLTKEKRTIDELQSKISQLRISTSSLQLKVSTQEAEISKRDATIAKKESELTAKTKAVEENAVILSRLNEQLTRARDRLSSKLQVTQYLLLQLISLFFTYPLGNKHV